MRITGIVENDTIKLPIHVPDGAKVEIIVTEESAEKAMPVILREVWLRLRPKIG